MKYGITLPPFGDFADPLALAQLATDAEAAGWDGFFIWDHVIFDPSFHPIADPWVGLAAVALHTRQIRLGTMVTPLARRRPWKIARETVSLDRLSAGRLILGVGLGDPVQWDYGFFGEETDARTRARKLDEALDILAGLWSGEPFSYTGKQYNIPEVRFTPRPRQTPRIPIWVGGWWPNRPPLIRAARWDGVCPGKWGATLTPDEWQLIMEIIRTHRTSDTPYDFVHAGATPGENPAAATQIVEPYRELGITWWIETVDPWRFGWDWEAQWPEHGAKLMRERVLQGPPRL